MDNNNIKRTNNTFKSKGNLNAFDRYTILCRFVAVKSMQFSNSLDCLETAPTPDANGTEKQIIELVAHQNLSILFVTDEQ